MPGVMLESGPRVVDRMGKPWRNQKGENDYRIRSDRPQGAEGEVMLERT